MKKLYSLASFILCVCIILSPMTVLAQDNNENQTITKDDVLAYYNSSLPPDEQLTDYPDFSDIIPTGDPYEGQEWEHYYPENMTYDEINEVIERIANGEHVVFGDGRTVDFSEYVYNESSSGMTPYRWKAGGADNTHQWLVARALVILQNEKSSVYNQYGATEKSLVLSGSDWPDENETDYVPVLEIPTNSGHFYYWPLKSNYFGSTTADNAKKRFLNWYNTAVTEWKAGNTYSGAYSLGKAIHYFCDIYTPMHTGQLADPPTNFIFLIGPHMDYETQANTNKTTYAVSSGGLYNGYLNYTLSYISDVIAAASYGHFPSDSSQNAASYGWALDSAQRDLAGLLNKFILDVNTP